MIRCGAGLSQTDAGGEKRKEAEERNKSESEEPGPCLLQPWNPHASSHRTPSDITPYDHLAPAPGAVRTPGPVARFWSLFWSHATHALGPQFYGYQLPLSGHTHRICGLVLLATGGDPPPRIEVKRSSSVKLPCGVSTPT